MLKRTCHYCMCNLNFASIFQTYSAAGPELCTALDVALAKGGTEAVVESFYSKMKVQYRGANLSNDTLVDRTIIDACYPVPLRCPSTVEAVARLYANGNEKLGLVKHRVPRHTDIRERGIYSETSKVISRMKEDFPLEALLEVKDRKK